MHYKYLTIKKLYVSAFQALLIFPVVPIQLSAFDLNNFWWCLISVSQNNERKNRVWRSSLPDGSFQSLFTASPCASRREIPRKRPFIGVWSQTRAAQQPICSTHTHIECHILECLAPTPLCFCFLYREESSSFDPPVSQAAAEVSFSFGPAHGSGFEIWDQVNYFLARCVLLKSRVPRWRLKRGGLRRNGNVKNGFVFYFQFTTLKSRYLTQLRLNLIALVFAWKSTSAVLKAISCNSKALNALSRWHKN